jgi:hypothetical protein
MNLEQCLPFLRRMKWLAERNAIHLAKLYGHFVGMPLYHCSCCEHAVCLFFSSACHYKVSSNIKPGFHKCFYLKE